MCEQRTFVFRSQHCYILTEKQSPVRSNSAPTHVSRPSVETQDDWMQRADKTKSDVSLIIFFFPSCSSLTSNLGFGPRRILHNHGCLRFLHLPTCLKCSKILHADEAGVAHVPIFSLTRSWHKNATR